ncbi:PREDICTED: interferon-induced protein 44-like [Cyprinodon variegatus]|uniref:interferon-induced protein 44-like n=1 Tax=Cyprinodon variegatus TaxID=28743 RepID=UPI00074279B8|nr:PREDICTED: interferon-induced protein 44-like [Cyprinodon variegatus]
MGCQASKRPSQRSYLPKPWLQIDWGAKSSKLEFLKGFQPQAEGQQLRILLHGPPGAGKSSFINSVNSVLQGKVIRIAPVNNAAQASFTKKNTSYRIKKPNEESFYPFVLNDTMSLKTKSSRRVRRVHVKDMKKAMKGHIKDGYTFNPECSLSKSDGYYNTSPNADDKAHILVCVIDATSELRNDVIETIQDIRDDATDLGIHQVAIFTKIDEACAKTKKEIRNVCRSKLLHDRVQDFSEKSGIPENDIFTIKNYYMEKDLDTNVDVLILNALKRIIEIGNEALNKN